MKGEVMESTSAKIVIATIAILAFEFYSRLVY